MVKKSIDTVSGAAPAPDAATAALLKQAQEAAAAQGPTAVAPEGEAVPVIEVVTPTEPATETPPATEEPTKGEEAPLAAEPAKEEAAPEMPAATEEVAPAMIPAEDSAMAEPPATETDEDSFSSLFPEPTVTLAGPPTWVWWILLGVSSLVVIGIGVKLLTSNPEIWKGSSASTSPTPTASVGASSSPAASATPASTPAATATPAPTATSVSSVSSLSLRILNGTTIAGAAAKAQTVAQKAGYTVKSVGNATNQTYTASIVYYKTGKEAEATALKTAMADYAPTIQLSDALVGTDDLLLVVAK